VIVQLVRFKSRLSAEAVQAVYEARAPQYRAMPGLLQKYYLKFPATQEHGAVLFWQSEEAATRFEDSELARTIPSAYQVQEEPDKTTAEVVMALRPNHSPVRI
jgi:heme-degrading monooxygenase HmoA